MLCSPFDRKRFPHIGWLFVFPIALAGTGCAKPLRSTLPDSEYPALRQSAIRFLVDAAESDDPVLRMQAIEAFQEVAPAEGEAVLLKSADNAYAGVSFAALMALGTIRDARAMEIIRTRAEDHDVSVRIAALFAMHRLGDKRRTGELSDFLLNHPDARVRANAALAIGRLAEPQSTRLLRTALRRERKDAVKMQILEALAMLGDTHGIERLRFFGHSAVPDQSALALMLLANAQTHEAEELFRYRLDVADHPEIKLQAARGLGRLGYDDGLDLALAYLSFNSPDTGRRNDPPEQQIIRVRALAALALEAIGSPESMAALKAAFELPGQPARANVAVARALIRIIDRRGSRDNAGASPTLRAATEPGELTP